MDLYPNKPKWHRYLSVWYALFCVFMLFILAIVFGWDIYIELALVFIFSSIVLSIYRFFCLVAYFREHPLKNYHITFVNKLTKRCVRYLFFLLMSLFLTLFPLIKIKSVGIDIPGISVLAGGFFLLLCFFAPDWIQGLNYAAIHPYFEVRVGSIHTYGSGVSIARKINILDNLNFG